MTDDTVNWLLENGNSVIRYRTATELLDSDANVDLGQLTKELLANPLINLWLGRLTSATGFNQVHGGRSTTYENAVGKLTQLGCRQGIVVFDEKTAPFRSWFAREGSKSPANLFLSSFQYMLVGTFLTVAQYHQDQTLKDYLAHRLDLLYQFAARKDYNIYTNRSAYSDIPEGFRNKPLVHPDLYLSGEGQLPSIYDIHALAHYPDELIDRTTQHKIDTVIDYVLAPEYQAFPDGYGIMRAGKRRYYAIGWSVHLDGYRGFAPGVFKAERFIQRLALMAHFPTAREHRWFRESIEHLEGYRTVQGTYVFPRSYLQERRSGYWVAGAYMGLEHNRRSERALELESTFWMLAAKQAKRA